MLCDRLVGSFALVTLETRGADGTSSHGFGERPRGRFIFDRGGTFAVQLMNPDTHPGPGSFMAMFGSYAVDEEHQTFTLTPAGALDPTVIGTQVVRHVERCDDELAVFRTPTQTIDGAEITTFITWRREPSGTPA